ncbi:hypothetical protein LLID5_05850 [Lactococcus lactis]|nr:hypothetical protein LLID5_05850 [Lactococcus lactis]
MNLLEAIQEIHFDILCYTDFVNLIIRGYGVKKMSKFLILLIIIISIFFSIDHFHSYQY